jgi:ribosome-binding factor A
MSSRRVLKAAQAIREVVSMAILTELKDPRVCDVTVTFVEVSADLRLAKVHVSIMGNDKKKELCLRGLKHASGYLQKKVGTRIDTRYTPRVQFVLDKGVENSLAVARILHEVLPKAPLHSDDLDVDSDDGPSVEQDPFENEPVSKEDGT